MNEYNEENNCHDSFVDWQPTESQCDNEHKNTHRGNNNHSHVKWTP